MLYRHLALLLLLHGVSSEVLEQSTCSSEAEIITDAEGWINSPNFPGNFTTKLSCRWKIFSENEIRLTIEHLDILPTEYRLADMNNCAANLEIYADGKQVRLTQLNGCAESLDELLEQELSIRKGDYENVTVDIVFTSEHGYDGTGFSIFYTKEIPMKNCNYTRLGILCQRWDEEYPHKPLNRPKSNDRAHNFCRNPDNDFRGPWCYTVNPRVRWEYCVIDDCDGPYTPLIAFKQSLWYPLIGVAGLITVVSVYICLRHRCKKVKAHHTQPVGMQPVAMVDIIDERRDARATAKESMLTTSS